MLRLARITRAQFFFPPIQKFQRAPRIRKLRRLNRQPNGNMRRDYKNVGVDVSEEPGNYIEVFVMPCRQPSRIPFCFRHRNNPMAVRVVPVQQVLHRWLGILLRAPTRQKLSGNNCCLHLVLRFFICSNTRGKSRSRDSPVTKSLARMSPRATSASASRIKCGV